jgi:hypothetical protein
MPVVLAGDLVPRPVRGLEVVEDHASLGVRLRAVGPHVEVPLPAPPSGGPGSPEPRVLVGRVVEHELGDHTEVPPVRLAEQRPEVAHRPVGRMDRLVRGDVVSVVAERGRIERQQPDRGRPQVANVVEPLDEPTQVADPVRVAVLERSDVQLVDHGILVPTRRRRRERRGPLLVEGPGRRDLGRPAARRHAARLLAGSIARTCPGSCPGCSCT